MIQLAVRIIKSLIEGGTLLKNANPKNVNGSSYDLSLGDQYWQNGEQKILDDDNGFIHLKPGDFVIVSSKEIAEIPKYIVKHNSKSLQMKTGQ